jgi:hypothetical protein
MTTTIFIISSVAYAAAGLSLDLEYLKLLQLISSSAQVLAIIGFSNGKLDNDELLKSSDSYELWSPKMLIIFEAIGLSEIVVRGINPSALGCAEELITFQLPHRQELLVII